VGYLLQYQSHVEDLTSLAGNPEDISWLIQQPVEQPLRASLPPLGDLVGDFTSGVVVDPDDGSAFIQASDPPLRAPWLQPLGISVGDYSSDAATPADTSWFISYPDFAPLRLEGPRVGWFSNDLSTVAAIVWSFFGDDWPLVFNSSRWGRTIKLEAYLAATAGTVYARLYNETDASGVAGSQVEHNTSTRTRVTSSALTLTDTKTYRAQLGRADTDTGSGKVRLFVE